MNRVLCRRFAILATLLLMPLKGRAETFCAVGYPDVEKSSSLIQAAAAIRAKCRAGDIVALPPKNALLPGLVCDFSKSIVLGIVVLCTLGEQREYKSPEPDR